MIAKLNDDMLCVLPSATDPIEIIVMVTAIMLVVVMNCIILVTHLMFKELRTAVFGKLLMLYNLLILCLALSFVALVVILISQTGGLLIVCHGLIISTTVLAAGSDMTATCMLHCLPYILYHSYKLQQISEHEFKNLFK